MFNRRVIFRVDGSAEIGLGHQIRCLAFAKILEKYFTIHFVYKYTTESFLKQINSLNYEVQSIVDENEFIEKLNPIDIVVLDIYNYDFGSLYKIKNICKLIIIDDLFINEVNADIILNYAPNANVDNYVKQSDSNYALGLNYVLLRQSFLEKSKEIRTINRFNVVTICIGGSDYFNITKKVLSNVIKYPIFKEINVVTGEAYKHYDTISHLFADKRVNHYNNLSENELSELLSLTDISIVSSSSILLEALACKSIVISGKYVENQKHLYSHFESNGEIIPAMNFENESINAAIKNALNIKLPYKCSNIINGQSPKNIIYKILQSFSILRPINQNDSELLYKWVNESSVRANAVNNNIISKDEHLNWFDRIMRNKCVSKIYILEFLNIPIGQIRYELIENKWVIDFSIDNNYRGMGFGKLILFKSVVNFKNVILSSIVKSDNISSIKAFESNGFMQIGVKKINNITYNNYEKYL